MVKDVISNVVLELSDEKTRYKIARLLSKTVFAGMEVTDIATPEEVDELKLVYAIDMPNNRGQKILMIETANSVFDRDNIKINLQ